MPAPRRDRELLSSRAASAHRDVLEATRAAQQALRDGRGDSRRLQQVVIVGLPPSAAAIVNGARLRR